MHRRRRRLVWLVWGALWLLAAPAIMVVAKGAEVGFARAATMQWMFVLVMAGRLEPAADLIEATQPAGMWTASGGGPVGPWMSGGFDKRDLFSWQWRWMGDRVLSRRLDPSRSSHDRWRAACIITMLDIRPADAGSRIMRAAASPDAAQRDVAWKVIGEEGVAGLPGSISDAEFEAAIARHFKESDSRWLVASVVVRYVDCARRAERLSAAIRASSPAEWHMVLALYDELAQQPRQQPQRSWPVLDAALVDLSQRALPDDIRPLLIVLQRGLTPRWSQAEIEAVRAHLLSGDEENQRFACAIIQDVGPGAAELAPQVLPLLDDRVDTMRASAVLALDSCGGPHADAVIQALEARIEGEAPWVRQLMDGALKRMKRWKEGDW